MNRENALKLANLAIDTSKDSIQEIYNFCENIADINANYRSWNGAAAKMLPFLQSIINDETPAAAFEIIQDKNGKLPFLNYSSCPIVNCPGAGECKVYCYSLRAWRYPMAFFRQLQNTILERNNFEVITAAILDKINGSGFKNKSKIDFRLYVDGDFPTYKILDHWLNFLAVNPRLAVYGYSKSLHLFQERIKAGDQWPNNYVLNLSNGGLYDSLHSELMQHVQVRGKFYAVSIGRKTKPQKLTTAERVKIRKQAENKVFICPGLCGSCTSAGHACGNISIFKNKDIVIPIH